jgi:hypothetical protein
METGQAPIQWAPRVKPGLIRRLYDLDAQGIYDEELIDEVGWGLLARCQSFIDAVNAVAGRAVCHGCGEVIAHNRDREALLVCPRCGWRVTWGEYFQTIQHRQLSGAEHVLEMFQGYIDTFRAARGPAEKMLLIDRLLHGFHWYVRFGSTRAVAVNLIEGRLGEVIALLDRLSYSEASTSGTRETWTTWRETIEGIKWYRSVRR